MCLELVKEKESEKFYGKQLISFVWFFEEKGRKLSEDKNKFSYLFLKRDEKG